MIILETSFLEAENEFKRFLVENNLPTDILWLFREDAISRNTKLYEVDFWLKPPSQQENRKIAEKYYEIGKQKGLGIGLSAFAICGGKIGCSLILPKDSEDSELLLMSPKFLKFSFVNDMPSARTVKSSLKWWMLKINRLKYKQGCYLVYLPSKHLQF